MRTSLRCVLQQMQNGLLKVIGYPSKAFSEAELRYCTTRHKLAAIMYGPKYYRHFLLGFPFVLRTDHAALTHLLHTPNPVAQSARYLDTLAEYQFTLQYRPGLSHKNADAMSRRPCNREPDQPLCKQCGPLHDPLENEEDSPHAGSIVVDDARTMTYAEQFNLGPSITSPATSFLQHAQGAGQAENAGPPQNAGPVESAGPDRNAAPRTCTMSVLEDAEDTSHAPSTMGLGTSFQSNGDQHDVVNERPDSGPLEASSATASGQDQQNAGPAQNAGPRGPCGRP